MRAITLEVGNTPIGTALTWAYPNGRAMGLFRIPTYSLDVLGKTDDGAVSKRRFEVFRFGVQGKSATQARVVGLADQQTHVIKAWLPHYTVHSARSVEKGAWQVYDDFLIHDGPDDPKTEVYASIGCVEVCNGPRGFDDFNNYLISLSGSNAPSRNAKLSEIGRSGKMKISYMKATRPPLTKP